MSVWLRRGNDRRAQDGCGGKFIPSGREVSWVVWGDLSPEDSPIGWVDKGENRIFPPRYSVVSPMGDSSMVFGGIKFWWNLSTSILLDPSGHSKADFLPRYDHRRVAEIDRLEGSVTDYWGSSVMEFRLESEEIRLWSRPFINWRHSAFVRDLVELSSESQFVSHSEPQVSSAPHWPDLHCW